MIRENQRWFNFIMVLIDIVVIVLSLAISWWIRFKTTIFGPIGGHLPIQSYMLFLLFVVIPVYLILYFSFGLYKPRRTYKTIFSEATQIIKVNIVAFVVLVAILFILNQPDFSRIMLFLLAVVATVLGIIERSIIRGILKKIRIENRNLKHILIVGDNDLAFSFARKIRDNPYLGFDISGFLGRSNRVGLEIEGSKIIGSFKDLDYILENNTFDRVVLAIPLKYYYKINELVESCERVGIKAEIIPDYIRYFPAQPSVDMIEDIPIINIRYVPLDDAFNRAVKSLSDYIIAIIAIIITSPIMIVTAIAIKLTSPGPIIFKQERIGFHGKPFEMYKFRSMKVQNPDDEKSGWTTKDDPRKTKIGDFIRKTSIDELPQLFNVLKGDMSLVGTRPPTIDEVKQYDKRHWKRLVIWPGITGNWQVNGRSKITDFEKVVDLDVDYIDNWTIWLDFKILLKTVKTVLFKNDAY